jgi:hypothetical protein
MEVNTFTCSICGESSRDICVFCTKDACGNHLCERCHRCSDCCECAMRLQNEQHAGDLDSLFAAKSEGSNGLNRAHPAWVDDAKLR